MGTHMMYEKRERPTSTYQILDVLNKVKSETVNSLENNDLNKKKRKRLKRIIRTINKINKRVIECHEQTGNCDGLTMTIAKGGPKSKKIKSGDYIVEQITNNSVPTDSFGTSKSRYTIKYYRTLDTNLFIEDTKHQPKIQEQRKIRLVGKNIVKIMRNNK